MNQENRDPQQGLPVAETPSDLNTPVAENIFSVETLDSHISKVQMSGNPPPLEQLEMFVSVANTASLDQFLINAKTAWKMKYQ